MDTYKAADYRKEFKEIKALEENVAVTGVTLSESSITFKRIGKTKQLIATVLPEDATNTRKSYFLKVMESIIDSKRK